MRSKLFSVALLIVVLAWMVPSGLSAAENPVVGGQGGSSDDQKYEGTYTVSPKGSADAAEKGTWKVAKSAAAKTGQ